MARAVKSEGDLEQAYRAFIKVCEVEVLDALGESMSQDHLGTRGLKPTLVSKHPLQEVGRHTVAGAVAGILRELEANLKGWKKLPPMASLHKLGV